MINQTQTLLYELVFWFHEDLDLNLMTKTFFSSFFEKLLQAIIVKYLVAKINSIKYKLLCKAAIINKADIGSTSM